MQLLKAKTCVNDRGVSAGTSPPPWIPRSLPVCGRPVVSGDPAHQHPGQISRNRSELYWDSRLTGRLLQGLLKVAVENARVQDKQIQAEKRELKMELYREREMRESLERQLTSELQSRGVSAAVHAAAHAAAHAAPQNMQTKLLSPQPPSRSASRRRRRPRGSCRRRWSSSPRGGRGWRTPSNTRPRPPPPPSRCMLTTATTTTV